MPMHRWIQSAAGGTSQRLKPAFAIVCSRSRMPSFLAPDIVPSLLIVVICPSLQPPVPSMSVDYDPIVPCPNALRRTVRTLPSRTFPDAPGSRSASKFLIPDATGYAHRQRRPCVENMSARLACATTQPRPILRTPAEMSIGAEAARCVDRQKVAIYPLSTIRDAALRRVQ